MPSDSHYVIAFHDPEEGEVVTLRARDVADSPLGLSFLRIADFVFEGGRSIVNPKDEALQRRLKDVRSLHISIHRVLSIAEVGAGHEGLTFDHDRSNLVAFPAERDPG